MKRSLLCFTTAFLFCVVCGTSRADVITPGTEGVPDIFSFTCPGAGCPTLLASTTTSWTNSTSTMSGSFEAAVFSDPNNTFGAGDLDFVFQVSNNSGSMDSVGRVTGINFTGFLTDVGYTATGSALGGGFVNGTVAPQLVDRASGDVVGFTFSAPLLVLVGPGETSTVLVIETNATNFKAGSANLIDGGVTTVSSFEPAGSVTAPEPSSIALLGLGLLGLLGTMRRRKLAVL